MDLESTPAVSRISLRIPTADIHSISDDYERDLLHSTLWLSPALAASVQSRVTIPKALGTLETLRVELHYILYFKDLLDEALSLDGTIYIT